MNRNRTLFSAIQGTQVLLEKKMYCPYLEFQPGMKYLKLPLKQSVFSFVQGHGLGSHLSCSWIRAHWPPSLLIWSHDVAVSG